MAEALIGVFSAGPDADQQAFAPLRACANVDLRFSELRCAKALPQALAAYKEGLPAHYVQEYHENKVRATTCWRTWHSVATYQAAVLGELL